MPIPELIDNVLPEGVHDCTIDEIAAVFGRFQRSDRRIELTEKLRIYLIEAKRSGIVQAVIINGSYVMTKDEPEDIDLVIVLPADWTWPEEIKPFQYNAVTKRGIKRVGYPFDAFPLADGSADLVKMLDLFTKVHPEKHVTLTSQTRKGVLRVNL